MWIRFQVGNLARTAQRDELRHLPRTRRSDNQSIRLLLHCLMHHCVQPYLPFSLFGAVVNEPRPLPGVSSQSW